MKGFTIAQFAGTILLSMTAFIFIITPKLKSPDPARPKVVTKTESETEEATQLNAADTLMMECPDIVKYGIDIEEIRMTLDVASLTAQREKQWPKQISAEVIIMEDAQYLPKGHHCRYDMGISPIGEWGFYSSKKECLKLCNMTANKGYGYKVIMHSIASEAAQ